MDFDPSKENIQPLRGGRIPSQLEVALQAQTDAEHQRELQHQKAKFEALIRDVRCPDPLENWFQYISWLEQSFPSQGHGGCYSPVLEECLKQFEHDPRYTQDRRLCKLFIKYFDLQENPTELFQLMYAQDVCRGCADLYIAWAYYYEANGDFQSANRVFECGKREMAQPYEELFVAHEQLVLAAGRHIIYGSDQKDLENRRQALTSLMTQKSGQIGSVRIVANPGPGALEATAGVNRSQINSKITAYEDDGQEFNLGLGSGAPISIMKAVHRQEVSKENILKPGPWTTVPAKRKPVASYKKTPSFTVHEDAASPNISISKIVPETLENYSNWIVTLTIPEEVNATMLPMYPKRKVYRGVTTEYSLEELRTKRYKVNSLQNSVSTQDISMKSEKSSHDNSFAKKTGDDNNHKIDITSNEQQDNFTNTFNLWDSFPPSHENGHVSLLTSKSAKPAFSIYEQTTVFDNVEQQGVTINNQSELKPSILIFEDDKELDNLSRLAKSVPNTSRSNLSKENVSEKDLWTTMPRNRKPLEHKSTPSFTGNAMKTPFNGLNAEELAETGSRGGMDVAAAAPVDSAKRLPLFDDESSSYNKIVEPPNFEDIHCNTQMFCFNLNSMKVSTPQTKSYLLSESDTVQSKLSPRQLFSQNADADHVKNILLSPIAEESKISGQSSSCSSMNTRLLGKPLKQKSHRVVLDELSSESSDGLEVSKHFGHKTNYTGSASDNFTNANESAHHTRSVIPEQHTGYLAQNLMANAALRSSSLGELMDFENHQHHPTPPPSLKTVSPVEPRQVSPLDFVPSDPFRHELIKQLLARVNFPGQHRNGYVIVNNIAKMQVRREMVNIGPDRYSIEKQLGKGTYGVVFRGMSLQKGQPVAVKFQKPANKWEFYICRELRDRLASHPLRDRFMDVQIGYFSDISSVLISEFVPSGSLLDVANMVKQKSGRPVKESLCIHFCLDMLKVVQAMHEVKIIHADIKPDNFLVKLFPSDIVGLQIIDFGCSIDMSLFPSNASFTRKVTTEDFICCEMLDNRPWNYHTDLFCIAATAHVLLFEKYIQLQKKDQNWSISNRLPRYARLDLWNMFFGTLLNQQDGPANTAMLQKMLEDSLNHKFDDYHNELRYLTNLLKNR